MTAPYYQDDFATIYHGDCREVLPALEPADLLVTDPPYGVNYVGRGEHGLIVGDEGVGLALAVLPIALHKLKFHRHFYVFGPFLADLTRMTEGATVELIWDEGKQGGGNVALPWGSSHEHVTFGVWSPYASQKNSGALAARLRRGSVLSYPTPNNGKGALDHPTRKPVELLRVFIESSSHFGEVVLDPFMGSGSTLVAARLEGRRSIGIEVEERYCELAAKSLSQGVLDFGAA